MAGFCDDNNSYTYHCDATAMVKLNWDKADLDSIVLLSLAICQVLNSPYVHLIVMVTVTVSTVLSYNHIS